MNKLIVSLEQDPHYNLALEEELLFETMEGVTLYLWQNRPTVVIGHNQNAWEECDPQELTARGIALARRLSGGGAVYHDLGNLNFTFLCREAEDDPARWQKLILESVRSFGIPCAASGRNDLLCEGKKFSGQAFYAENGVCYHHGTLLISVDLAQMQAALRPSPIKLKEKGIASVRSRVMNLAERAPTLTVEQMARALAQRFRAERETQSKICFRCAESHQPKALVRYQSREWNWGAQPVQRQKMELRTEQGTMQLWIEEQAGCIAFYIRISPPLRASW